MKVIKVQQQPQGYKVTTEDNKEHSIPNIKGTFLYKETKAFLASGGVIEPEFTQAELDKQAQDKAIQDAKEAKAKELNELVIAMNTVNYDANQEAIGNMAAVVAVATATFQRAISIGVIKAGETGVTVMTPAEAYKYVYKDQTVTWKGADNKPHTVQLESLVEASQKAMTAKAAILFKY